MNSEASIDEATESIAYDTSRGVAVVNGVRANVPEFADKTRSVDFRGHRGQRRSMRFGVLGASLSLESPAASAYAIKNNLDPVAVGGLLTSRDPTPATTVV